MGKSVGEWGEKKKNGEERERCQHLVGERRGEKKKRGERDGVFSHADHLTCPYIFACGPIKRSVYEN